MAAGEGVCPLGEHVSRYFARPGIAFRLRPLPAGSARAMGPGPAPAETAKVRAFLQTARRLLPD
ncbi:hypothetical protein GCM10023259_094680 [Thermocatellispora tengchongensis]